MKRLILDHFRRWWWVLALGGALQFRFGWTIAKRPEDTFEFWVFLVALWMGANLLGFDLKHGVARAVLSLPLTGRQVGRGWWLATIPLPALALTALLISGAATFHWLHPDTIFPTGRLTLGSLFALPWLGTAFTAIYGMNNDVIFGNWRQRASGFFFSVLSIILLFGGMLTLQNSTRQPFKLAVYLGVGALLIVAGWVRAERFVLGRASFRLVAPRYIATRGQPGAADESLRRLEAFRPPATASRLRKRLFDTYLRWLEGMAGKNLRGEHHAPGGYGGIPFLIKTTFVRTFLILMAMVALIALIMHWQRQTMPQGMDVTLFAPMASFMSCFFIFILQPMLVPRHLRLLRTLPISATRLAAVMMAFALLPLIASGALVAGLAGLSWGTPAALTILKSYAFILAPAALCVFFAVWRGTGKQGYVLLLLTLFGFQMAPLWLQGMLLHPKIPESQTGAFVVLCVLLAFLLTRRALRHSSHAYRIPASPSGGLP